MLLEERVVFVSGVGPGLGQELVRAAAREGAHVVLAARSDELTGKLADEVRAAGREALALRLDLTRADDCAAAAEATRARFGRVDALLHNAYQQGAFEPIAEVDLADWEPPWQVNVIGALRLTQALLPLLEASSAPSVIPIGSMIVRHPLATLGAYAASKGALLVAAQTLARELGPRGIRVNSVLPGYIRGPALDGYFAAQAAERGVEPALIEAEVAAEIALGRIPEGDEVADAVLLLASERARAVTGATLDVNGGHFLP